MNASKSIRGRHNSGVSRYGIGRLLPLSLRRLLPALTAAALLCAAEGHAALRTLVSSTAQASFTSLVYVDKTSAPEWVLFTGEFAVATEVVAPGGACTPTAPCTQDGGILAFTRTISGVGMSSGLRYQLAGLSLVKRDLQVPGSTIVQLQCVVVLPRTIRPVKCLVVTVPVSTVITFDSHGAILQAAAPPNDLAGWWQAEGTAADAMGNNSSKVSSSEPVTFVPGRVGTAFHFSNSGFVEVQSSPALEPARITAAAWVRAEAPPAPFSYLLSKGALACETASYAFTTGPVGGLQFYVSDGTSAGVSADVGPGVWDGHWHFVAGTFDGATVRLYVDGVEVGTGTPAPITINYALPDNNKFYIGAYGGTCPLRFRGDMDDIQVFGRALTPVELLGLYNAQQ